MKIPPGVHPLCYDGLDRFHPLGMVCVTELGPAMQALYRGEIVLVLSEIHPDNESLRRWRSVFCAKPGFPWSQIAQRQDNSHKMFPQKP